MTRILTIIALLFATPAWAEINLRENLYRSALPCESIPVITLAKPELCFADRYKADLIYDNTSESVIWWRDADFQKRGLVSGFFELVKKDEHGRLFVYPRGNALMLTLDQTVYYSKVDNGLIFGASKKFDFLDLNGFAYSIADWLTGTFNIAKRTHFFLGKKGSEPSQIFYFSADQLAKYAESRIREETENLDRRSDFSIDLFMKQFRGESSKSKLKFWINRETNSSALFAVSEQEYSPNREYKTRNGSYAYLKNFRPAVGDVCGENRIMEYMGPVDANLRPLGGMKSVYFCSTPDGKIERKNGFRGTKKFEKHFRNAVELIYRRTDDMDFARNKLLEFSTREKIPLDQIRERTAFLVAAANKKTAEEKKRREETERRRIAMEEFLREQTAERERLQKEAAEAERLRIAEEERLQKEAAEAERLRIAEEERLQKEAARDRKMAPLRAKCDSFGYKRGTPQFNQCVSDQEALLELREIAISKRQEERELERLEEQRQEEAKIEQLKAIERATRETNARIARAQEQANRQAEEQRRMQANQNLMNLGLSIMNNGLGNQGYSAPPSMPRAGTTGCFLKGSYVSGFNRICNYNCTGSGASHTIGATDICPLSR